MSEKAVGSGRVSAAKVFAALHAKQFCIFSRPRALVSVQTRLEDVLLARKPTDPFHDKPELGDQLRAALRAH